MCYELAVSDMGRRGGGCAEEEGERVQSLEESAAMARGPKRDPNFEGRDR